MYDELLNVSEAAKLLGVSPSTLRRIEKNGAIEGYGLRVIYTPGGQRRYLFDEVQMLYTNQGFSGEMGLGVKPALLIRDLTKAFTTPCSQMAVRLGDQIQIISNLIDQAIISKIPVIFSMTIYDPKIEASNLWGRKFPNIHILDQNSTWVDIHTELADKPYDLINKTVHVSDLYNSPIESFLKMKEVDTLILAGVTTSGSIRANAIDAMQRGYHVVIPREAVADRSDSLQTFALMDLNARYVDVQSVVQVIEYIKKVTLK